MAGKSESEEFSCKCDTCNRTFWSLYCLRQPVKIHTSPQDFSCKVCLKEFSSATSLERHITNKHKIEGKHSDTALLENCLLDTLTADGFQASFEYVQDMEKNPTDVQEITTETLTHCKIEKSQETEDSSWNLFSLSDVDNEDIKEFCLNDAATISHYENNKDISFTMQEGETATGQAVKRTQRKYAEKILQCDICDESFNAKSQAWIKMHYHEKHDVLKPFSCTICGYNFSFQSGLQKHVKYVHKIGVVASELRVKCDLCNKTFSNKFNLQDHTRIHIGGVYTCADCGKEFNDGSNYRRHQRIHHGRVCYRKGNQVQNQPAHTCWYCNKGYNQRYRLREHVANVHTGEKNNICSVCGKSFFLNYELKRHMYVHTGEKVNQCHICDARFTRTFALKRHLKSHTNEGNRFECIVCKKVFTRMWTLQRHTMMHDGTEPFVCSICGDKFIFRIMLTTHMKEKHCPQTMVYKCDKCGHEYNTERKFYAHVRQHDRDPDKVYRPRKKRLAKNISVCETCGKITKNIRQHRITHTGARPFACPVCDKKFRQKNVMRTHLKIHTGDNFQFCMICNKYFTREIDLEYHLNGKIHERMVKRLAKRSHKGHAKDVSDA